MNTKEKIFLANRDKYITVNLLPEIFESFASMKQLTVNTSKTFENFWQQINRNIFISIC